MTLLPIHKAALQFVINQPLDLRKCSEAMRQCVIDLGMMEPPLVEVEGGEVRATRAGQEAAR